MTTYSLADVLADIEKRRQRERWYKPGIWMLWSLKRKIKNARFEIKWAWQRVFRGWDDRASWNIDHYLAKNLGEQMVAMAGFAHGYPGEHYPYDQWVADLKRHGEALLAYFTVDRHDDGDDWDENVCPAAQEALRWVADNLPTLWD